MLTGEGAGGCWVVALGTARVASGPIKAGEGFATPGPIEAGKGFATPGPVEAE